MPMIGTMAQGVPVLRTCRYMAAYANCGTNNSQLVQSVNICTDLTITTEKLMELFAPLDPGKVDELGGEHFLGLPQPEMDRIQKDYQSPTQRKEAYLDLYVHQHPCPTWGRVAGVLRNLVNLPQQAGLVENTYLKGTQDTHCSEAVFCVSIINTDCEALGFNYESIIQSHYMSGHYIQ